MRKLIIWNMVTLDGPFEGPEKWEVDWHNDAWSEDLEQFVRDQLLFGRVTYDAVVS